MLNIDLTISLLLVDPNWTMIENSCHLSPNLKDSYIEGGDKQNILYFWSMGNYHLQSLRRRKENKHQKMAINEIRVRDVTIPQSTNMTSCIQKPEAGGRFDMKQSMVQILHSNGKFTNLSHEDPTVHIQNFLEISDTYTQTTLKLEQIKIM